MVGVYGFDGEPITVVADPLGRFLYAANLAGTNVASYRIGFDGTLTAVQGSPSPGGASWYENMAIDPSGRFLYVLAGENIPRVSPTGRRRRDPTDGTIHWSSYRLAKELGISQSSVSRVCVISVFSVSGAWVQWQTITLSLKRRRLTSLAYFLGRRSMLQCSVSMRKALSKQVESGFLCVSRFLQVN